MDIKEDMRFEVILRMLMRVGIAEWLVANNVTIMKAFFSSAGNLVKLLSAGKMTELKIDSTPVSYTHLDVYKRQDNRRY